MRPRSIGIGSRSWTSDAALCGQLGAGKVSAGREEQATATRADGDRPRPVERRSARLEPVHDDLRLRRAPCRDQGLGCVAGQQHSSGRRLQLSRCDGAQGERGEPIRCGSRVAGDEVQVADPRFSENQLAGTIRCGD